MTQCTRKNSHAEQTGEGPQQQGWEPVTAQTDNDMDVSNEEEETGYSLDQHEEVDDMEKESSNKPVTTSEVEMDELEELTLSTIMSPREELMYCVGSPEYESDNERNKDWG